MKNDAKPRAFFLAVVLFIVCLTGAASARPPAAGMLALANPHMSDRPFGPAVTRFPSGTGVVYAVFDYQGDSQIQIKVKDNAGAVIFDHRGLYIGSGKESLPVAPAGGFPDGFYITNWYVDGYLAFTVFWEVTAGAGRVTPTPTATLTPASTPTRTATATPTPTGTPTPAGHQIYLPLVIR